MDPKALKGLVLIGFLAAATTAGRGGGAPADAFEQNRRLGRGVNILGYDPIWTSKGKARFKESYFRTIRDGGFDSVRINLHPFGHMDSSFRLDEAWLGTLDWAIRGATEAGLAVVLDLHEYNAMAADPAGGKAKFLTFWKQVAPRYKDAPPSVLFEIMNEPALAFTADLWNAWFPEALAVIRETNPDRTVVIGPPAWNSLFALNELRLPLSDRNIIVTVHYYLPMPFTHQGAPWTPEFKNLSGVEWNGTEVEQRAIRQHFEIARKWAEEEKRPIFLGEFGAYEKADMASRARYTSGVARAAESLGWSWAYWQFDSDFILYDIDKEQWVEPIHKALTPLR
jgi:endoglucanase